MLSLYNLVQSMCHNVQDLYLTGYPQLKNQAVIHSHHH